MASDVPALREVGGAAATFAPVGEVAAWVAACSLLLADPDAGPPRATREAQAARYSWSAHAAAIAAAYRARVADSA